MAFQFRRGTDAERQSITPKAGEPLFVTDTGKIFVGNGTTQGGLLVSTALSDDETPSLSGNLNLNNNDIVGTGNINIDGFITATGNINLGDGAEDNIIVGGVIGSSLIPDTDIEYDLGDLQSKWKNGYFQEIYGNLNGSVIGEDSVVLLDTVGNAELADINALSFTGDIFLQDSSILFDSVTGVLSPNDFLLPNNNLRIRGTSDNTPTELTLITLDDKNILRLSRESAEDLLETPFVQYGAIEFERNDPNSLETVAFLNAGNHFITLAAAADSAGLLDATNRITFFESKLGIGEANPQATLDVNGSAIIKGSLEADSVKGTLVGDDSNIIIDGINNTITSGGFIQFGSYTDTDRPDGVNGMVIYNSTVDRFQGYQNGAWINLDDGSTA